MISDERPLGYTIFCRECGECLDGIADDCCPACGTEFDPADDATCVTGPLPCSPYLAVLSALFVFAGPTLAVSGVLLALVLSAFGLSSELALFGFRSLVFAPVLCFPGVILAWIGYRRYHRAGQTVGVWVTRISLICGCLFLLATLCLCAWPGPMILSIVGD
jgi:hypothetical protein